MPRALWLLHNGRPSVQVQLILAANGQPITRVLLADTGAGSQKLTFDLLLRDADCPSCGATLLGTVNLSRAYRGPHPFYRLGAQIPALGFDQHLRVVGITSPPQGFDGTACFYFLNQFTYGNFGDPTLLGLER